MLAAIRMMLSGSTTESLLGAVSSGASFGAGSSGGYFAPLTETFDLAIGVPTSHHFAYYWANGNSGLPDIGRGMGLPIGTNYTTTYGTGTLLSTTPAGGVVTFTFATPVALAGGTKYMVRAYSSGGALTLAGLTGDTGLSSVHGAGVGFSLASSRHITKITIPATGTVSSDLVCAITDWPSGWAGESGSQVLGWGPSNTFVTGVATMTMSDITWTLQGDGHYQGQWSVTDSPSGTVSLTMHRGYYTGQIGSGAVSALGPWYPPSVASFGESGGCFGINLYGY